MVLTTPVGLFRARYTWPLSVVVMRDPSTLMTAVAGSTRVPSVRTTWPSTSTRPAAISASLARRLPTPAAASTFCSRTPSSGILGVTFLDGVGVGQVRRQRRQLVDRGHAEALQEVGRGAV